MKNAASAVAQARPKPCSAIDCEITIAIAGDQRDRQRCARAGRTRRTRTPRHRSRRRRAIIVTLSQSGGARVQPADVDADDVRQREAAADAGDDAGGGEQRLGQPGPAGDVEAGQGVLERAHEADAGEQHDDVRGDDQRRVDVEPSRRGGDREDRGDRRRRRPAGRRTAAGAAPSSAAAGRCRPRRRTRSRPRSRCRRAGAPTPAHITPQPRVTAQRGVLWPEETIRASRRARLRQVDPVAEHVADQVVDQGEVLVVDVALLDLPDLDERRAPPGWAGSSSTAR